LATSSSRDAVAATVRVLLIIQPDKSALSHRADKIHLRVRKEGIRVLLNSGDVFQEVCVWVLQHIFVHVKDVVADFILPYLPGVNFPRLWPGLFQAKAVAKKAAAILGWGIVRLCGSMNVGSFSARVYGSLYCASRKRITIPRQR
jgi:hypothetical protein